jgi:folylpolyglutamate synthase
MASTAAAAAAAAQAGELSGAGTDLCLHTHTHAHTHAPMPVTSREVITTGVGGARDFSGGVATATAEYEEVLGRLSSLITQKVRAHSGNRGNQWDLMAHYLKVRAFRSPAQS